LKTNFIYYYFYNSKTLAGQTSKVSSVCFDNLENFCAAGSVSGTTKIWDLEYGKGTFLFSFSF